MSEPIITFFAKIGDDEFKKRDEIDAGIYSGNSKIEVDLQIWNNYGGIADVEDLRDFNMQLEFADYEDLTLLQFCKLIKNGNNELSLTKNMNAALVSFPEEVVISGKKNNGNPKDNKDNYLDLRLIFEADVNNLKENDSKTLNIQIVPIISNNELPFITP